MVSTNPAAMVKARRPLFFCAPSANDEILHRHVNSNPENPAPWPTEPFTPRAISVKALDQETTFETLLGIIKATSLEWVRDMSDRLTLEWVASDADADIRISFRNDVPNWSCVGATASNLGQNEPTMNFSLGGWKNEKFLFRHADVVRMAGHLFGHALGIPHAKGDTPLDWVHDQLSTKYGAFTAETLMADKGSPELVNPSSIMLFDQPEGLGAGGSKLRGGAVIDDEARTLLQKLYPPFPVVICSRISASTLPGFRQGSSKNTPVKTKVDLKNAGVSVNGICRIDEGLGGNYRVYTDTHVYDQEDGVTAWVGATGDTLFWNADCNLLGFQQGDERIQCARINIKDWNEDLWGNRRPEVGVLHQKRIDFPKGFARPPDIVTFISGFDVTRNKHIRIHTSAEEIDTAGFTLKVGSWENTEIWNICVTWVAHEPDEFTIRSGSLTTGVPIDHPFYSVRSPVVFKEPMIRKPRHMFYAISRIDTPASTPLRLNVGVDDWDQNGFNATLGTWESESVFYNMDACYIAIL